MHNDDNEMENGKEMKRKQESEAGNCVENKLPVCKWNIIVVVVVVSLRKRKRKDLFKVRLVVFCLFETKTKQKKTNSNEICSRKTKQKKNRINNWSNFF